MMTDASPMLPQVEAFVPPGVRWFSGGGCVLEVGDAYEVIVGGLLIGRYEKGDIGTRNAILVGLMVESQVPMVQLAKAFGLSDEMLRKIRLRYERDGLGAVVASRRSRSKVDEQLRARLYKLFEEGKSVSAAYARVRRKIKRATVGRVRKEWDEARQAASRTADTAAASGDVPAAFPPVEVLRDTVEGPGAGVTETGDGPATCEEGGVVAYARVRSSHETATVEQVCNATDVSMPGPVETAGEQESVETTTIPMWRFSWLGATAAAEQMPARPEAADRSDAVMVAPPSSRAARVVVAPATGADHGAARSTPSHTAVANAPSSAADDRPLCGDSHAPHGDRFVQHAGGWLMLGALERYGLYQLARDACVKHGLDASDMRLALDSVALALTLRQGCVEGVRRLATPTASALLWSDGAPSADWVRRTLKGFADKGAEAIHLGMMEKYLRTVRSESGATVFYVDNHLRKYAGQEVLRRGWRMQDKRVRPGVTDYYVHDVEGNPLLREVSPSHASLPEVMLGIADLLRATLGEDARILLAFDRAGAYPDILASLRNESFEFVTYERRPYRLLSPSEFTRELVLDLGEGRKPETIRFAEFTRALGKGRGDVRRVAMFTPEEKQVNLLAIGMTPAEQLIAIQRGRWHQENGLKHGVERWHVNHLDGRRTIAYSPDTVVPNPARRRLDHALRAACVQEGLARRLLARLAEGNPEREEAEHDLADALALQQDLLARRPTTPKKAHLASTELAGKLVYHSPAYKTVLDTVRIACANAEADLAETLGRHLPRAAEAKMTLHNLLAAPGRVEVRPRTIHVELAPAGTGPEQTAYAQFCNRVNAHNLVLPGDTSRRALRFGVQPT